MKPDKLYVAIKDGYPIEIYENPSQAKEKYSEVIELPVLWNKSKKVLNKEMDIEKRIIKIISNQAGVNENEINSYTKLDELGMDSLDEVEIIMELEKVFGISIPDWKMDITIKTVQDVVNYITERITIR